MTLPLNSEVTLDPSRARNWGNLLLFCAIFWGWLAAILWLKLPGSHLAIWQIVLLVVVGVVTLAVPLLIVRVAPSPWYVCFSPDGIDGTPRFGSSKQRFNPDDILRYWVVGDESYWSVPKCEPIVYVTLPGGAVTSSSADRRQGKVLLDALREAMPERESTAVLPAELDVREREGFIAGNPAANIAWVGIAPYIAFKILDTESAREGCPSCSFEALGDHLYYWGVRAIYAAFLLGLLYWFGKIANLASLYVTVRGSEIATHGWFGLAQRRYAATDITRFSAEGFDEWSGAPAPWQLEIEFHDGRKSRFVSPQPNKALLLAWLRRHAPKAEANPPA